MPDNETMSGDSERVGDMVIRRAGPDDGECEYTVTGWSLRWACQSIEDARAAAALLDRVTMVTQDVWAV
jgi:hypothetical protein